MPSQERLIKPLKSAEKKWSRKERFMVLGLLFLTLFLVTLFWLKGQGAKLPHLSLPTIKLPIGLPESTIVFEAQEKPNSPSPAPAITDQFLSLTQNLQGTYGLYVFDLETNTKSGVRDQEIFPAASLTKLPVLITLYQAEEKGQINLDDLYTLKDKDKVTGAGSLQYATAGTQNTYRQLAQMMGKSSDNTAAHIISTRLGAKKINQTITQIGMTHTNYEDNTTTPADIGLLFQKLYQGQLLSQKSQQELLQSLTSTDWEKLIPAGIPPGITIAHKYASEVGSWSDAGIISAHPPFILVIQSRDAIEPEAFQVIPQIAKTVYQNLNS